MLSRFEVKTGKRSDIVDITSDVQRLVAKSGVKAGICVVWVPHTTAGITVNENADPAVKRDMLMELGKMVPEDDGYHHSEGNSDGHLKSSMMGHGETLIIEGGALVLGTWQGIYLCEFDGPRRREVLVKVLEG